MRDEGKLLELIASIHEAAVEPTTWPGVLERIADAVGRASIALVTAEDFDEPVDVWLARYDLASVDARFRHYARPEVNAGVRAAMAMPPLQVVPRRQISNDREFEQDPAARAILISQGLWHGCIATLHRAEALLSTVTIYRPRPAGDFDRAEIGILRRLVPHLAGALRVHRYLSASQIHRHQAEEALNQLDVGLLLLAEDGRIEFGYRAATNALRRCEGIKARGGKLSASHHADNARLAGAIARAAGQVAPRTVEALRLDRGPGRRPLQVWAVPLPREPRSFLLGTSASDVMVLLIDPELTPAPPLEALRSLYGLTEAEARLTCGLLKGERLEDYAEHTGISMNTARTHLKSVFAKTDTNRQAELVRLLSRALHGPE